jgi:hypothetical protein
MYIHITHSLPSGTDWSRKGEDAICSLSSLQDQSVKEGRECTLLTLFPPGPIGPGRERVHYSHYSHSLPSQTNWSRRGESVLFSLPSLPDRLVREGGECTLPTIFPPGPISPGRERVCHLTLLPPGPIGPGSERVTMPTLFPPGPIGPGRESVWCL